MKKMFFSLAAIVALFAVSCTTDMTSDVQVADEGIVTLTLKAPGAGSRADVALDQNEETTIGNGKKATELHYAVYDKDWICLDSQVISNFLLETTLELRLVKNKTYNFVFWAQTPGKDYYDVDLGTVGYPREEPKITVNYENLDANDDYRDAFFGKRLALVVDGTVNETIVLTRPFAQVNFGTTAADVNAAKKMGFDLTTATTSFKAQTYTTLYLKDGDVADLKDIEFVSAGLPENETLKAKTAAGTEYYYWAAMNYLLWTEKAVDQYDALATCSMTVKSTGNQDVTISYPGAPANRNYRTNLVGSWLTEQANIKVVINPIFANEEYTVEAWNGTDSEPALVNGVYQIEKAEELAWLFGKKLEHDVILLNDINLGGKEILPINPTFLSSGAGRQTFDGNGKTIANFVVNTQNANGGLFGTLIGDTVKNLTIDNAKVIVNTTTGEHYAAVVAGKTYGDCVFENVNVTNSSVNGVNKVGAIIGHAEDALFVISNCVVENCTIANHEAGTTMRAANPDSEAGLVGSVVGYINAKGTSTIGVSVKGCVMNVINGRGDKSRANGKIVGGIQDDGKVVLNVAELDVEFNDEANGYESPYGALIGSVRSGAPELDVTVEGAKVAWPDTFAAALNNGGVVGLVAGEYNLPRNVYAANLTILGLEENKSDVILNAKQSVSFGNSAVINIENLTYKVPYGLYYDEHQHGFLHFAKQFNMTNCLVDGGHLRLNVKEGNIEACEFVVPTSSGWDGYAIHYYGEANSTLNVKKSKFTTAGKAICIFSEGAKAYNLNVEECEFTSSNSSTDKAAIQMHSEHGIWGNVNITKCTATGFANVHGGLWNDVNNQINVPNNKFNVVVDGVTVQFAGLTPVPGYAALATNAEGEYCLWNTQSIKDWHDFAEANLYTKTHGVTYKLLNDIDAEGYVWVSMWLSESRNGMVIDGNNCTISNLVTNGGLFGGTASGYNGTPAIVKNLTFANLSTVSGHWNAAIWGALYGDLTLENVKVVDSELVGKCNVGAFIAGAANENFNPHTVIFKDCQVLNSKLVGEGYAGQDPTGASGFMGRAFNGLIIDFQGTNVVDEATVITNNNGLVGGRVYGYTIHDGSTFKGTGACDGFVDLNGVSYVETSDLSVLAPEGSNKKTVDAGQTVVLTDDIDNPAGSGGYGVAGLTVAGGVLDGNGHTLTTTGANGTWDAGVYHSGGTVKNLTVGGSFRGIFTAGCMSDINVENVVIDNVCYTFNSDTANPNYSVNFKNVVLNGWTSFTSGYKSVNFTDCTFSQGTGGYKYAYCRPYQATTFTNCDFNDGATEAYAIDSNKGVLLTFVNCRHNGVALTKDNIVELVNNVANVVIK